MPTKSETVENKPASTTRTRTRANGTKTGSTATKRSTSSRATIGSKLPDFGTSGAVIGAAAAGLIAGLAANLGRKVAVQALTATQGDWISGLKAEHAATLKLFDALEQTTPRQTTKRATLLMQIKHALAKHAFEEENAVYPALRDSGEIEEADSLNHDHGYVKQYLYDLETMPKDSQAWISKLGSFREALEKHIREEEDTIFPKLQSRLTEEQNSKLTIAMNKEGFKLA